MDGWRKMTLLMVDAADVEEVIEAQDVLLECVEVRRKAKRSKTLEELVRVWGTSMGENPNSIIAVADVRKAVRSWRVCVVEGFLAVDGEDLMVLLVVGGDEEEGDGWVARSIKVVRRLDDGRKGSARGICLECRKCTEASDLLKLATKKVLWLAKRKRESGYFLGGSGLC